MPVRKASAVWKGDLPKGTGNITTESGALKEILYNFVSRFETGTATNPEELLGAAHSSCFSMALANNLSKAGFKVNSINTQDSVHLEMLEGGPTVTKIVMDTVGEVEGINNETFQKYAEDTKKTCPIARALNVKEIVLNASLK